ncbi:DUF1134 domain-containing protein [Roseateles sp. DAIF2]|nr:DUF1134 domain-containing protein [Roseateles sp. DAIF2]
MRDAQDPDRRELLLGLGGACLALGPAAAWANEDKSTYDEDSILKAATEFFGDTTEGLAKVIEKAFKEQGRPNAYIKGAEAGAALTVGLRYGEGQLVTKGGGGAKVYWAGPSIGFDAGANASKVFTLVYRLPNTGAIFQRFPGVDGSAYYIGGAGINYQRLKSITLAPIRLGVGLRAGVSVGYLHYRREKSLNPF